MLNQPYTNDQLRALLRLSRNVHLWRDEWADRHPLDWRRRLLAKSLFSFLLDCEAAGCGAEAREVLAAALPPG